MLDFTFRLPDWVLSNKDFVVSRFCNFGWAEEYRSLCNTKDFVIKEFVKSRFHCLNLRHLHDHLCTLQDFGIASSLTMHYAFIYMR